MVVERKRVHRHRHSRHSDRGATVEIRRTTSTRGPAAIIVEERPAAERVIVEEMTRRSVSRGPRIVPAGSDEDEVVVIEEHSPPRRHRSRIRSSERRSSGYREVDPSRFAGGDAPMREIRRSSSRRS